MCHIPWHREPQIPQNEARQYLPFALPLFDSYPRALTSGPTFSLVPVPSSQKHWEMSHLYNPMSRVTVESDFGLNLTLRLKLAKYQDLNPSFPSGGGGGADSGAYSRFASSI